MSEREISVKEHIEKIFDLKVENLHREIDIRFQSIEDAITEARRIMESRMEGFPAMYAKKGELEQTAVTLKELKERDLKELKDNLETKLCRQEYEYQHKILVERMAGQESRIQGVEMLKAEMTGKVWTLGVVITLYTTGMGLLIGVILKYALGK